MKVSEEMRDWREYLQGRGMEIVIPVGGEAAKEKGQSTAHSLMRIRHRLKIIFLSQA